MRFILFFVLLIVSVSAMNTYSGTCRYDWAYVYETGYEPRSLTANEINQLKEYGSQWEQYGIQKSQYYRGMNSMPYPPVLPCFCHNLSLKSRSFLHHFVSRVLRGVVAIAMMGEGDVEASITKRDSIESIEKRDDEHEKKQEESNLRRCLKCTWVPAGFKREGRLFVKVTAMHGVRRWWETRGMVQKVLWLLAILACFITMLVLIVFNIMDFANDEGSTQVTHSIENEGMRLPKVTFCSNNPIMRSSIPQFNSSGKLTKNVQRYIILSNRDPMMIGKSSQELALLESEFIAYKKQQPNFTFRKFFENTGSKCNDVFKSCFFAGEQFECCQNKSVFNTSLTEMGLCHSITLFRNQKNEAENGGLQLVLDSQTADSIPMPVDVKHLFNYPITYGFRIFLEEPDMHTYRSSHGISVAAGQSLLSGIQLNRYILDSNCKQNWKDVKLKGHNTDLKYQARDCRSKCMAKLYNTTCQCAPLIFDIDSEYSTCTPKVAVECSTREEIRKASTFAKDTECGYCKIECERFDFQSYNSYGGSLSNDVVDALQEEFVSITAPEIKKNFVTVTIFYRELSSLKYAAVRTVSVGSLLSDIGGSAGLCLGFSALTFIEIVVFLCKSLCYCCRKKDLDKKGADYKENKQLERAAIESLKERHKRKHSGGGDVVDENDNTIETIRPFSSSGKDTFFLPSIHSSPSHYISGLSSPSIPSLHETVSQGQSRRASIDSKPVRSRSLSHLNVPHTAIDVEPVMNATIPRDWRLATSRVDPES